MKRLLIILTLCTPLLMQAQHVELTSAEWSPNGRELSVAYEIKPAAVKSMLSVTLTPMICGESDTLQLKSETWRGWFNERKQRRDDYFGKTASTDYRRAKDTATLSEKVTLDITEHPWLKTSAQLTLCAAKVTSGCECTTAPIYVCQPLPVHPGEFKPLLAPVHERGGIAEQLQETSPVLEPWENYRPYDKTRILRKEKGALYIYFPVSEVKVLDGFRDNGDVLNSLIDITNTIINDTTSNVKCIQIVGLASIDGNSEFNERIAAERAVALQRYIQGHVPAPDSMFESVGGGEAWTEFRDQMNDLRLAGGDSLIAMEEITAVMDIIDNEPDEDAREAQLKALNGGKTYIHIKNIVLADQRNSGYMKIYWSHKPDYAAIDINRASELVQQERYSEAVELLKGLHGDPRCYNTLGVALYMSGNYVDGLDFLHRAAEAGDEQATENLKQMEKNYMNRM